MSHFLNAWTDGLLLRRRTKMVLSECGRCKLLRAKA